MLLVAVLAGFTAKLSQISTDMSLSTYYHPPPGLQGNIFFAENQTSHEGLGSLQLALKGFKNSNMFTHCS